MRRAGPFAMESWCRRTVTHNGRDDDGRCERQQAAGPPQHTPLLSGLEKCGNQDGRDRDADADAGKMQRRERGAIGLGQVLQHDGGGKYQHECACRTADEAKHQEGGHGVGQAHGGRRQSAGCQRAEQQRAAGTGKARPRGEQRSQQIAKEVGRCDQASRRLAEAEAGHHRRQDRRVDEASDADGGRHRDEAAARGGGGAGGNAQGRWFGRTCEPIYARRVRLAHGLI